MARQLRNTGLDSVVTLRYSVLVEGQKLYFTMFKWVMET